MMPDNLTLFSPFGRSSSRQPERPRFSFAGSCQSELKRTLRRGTDCEQHRLDAPFRAKSAFSFSRNGEREVSTPDRYGFEIVHAPQASGGTSAAYQLKIYTKSNHSNFMQHKNRGFIRV
jgi:hypothetical protein